MQCAAYQYLCHSTRTMLIYVYDTDDGQVVPPNHQRFLASSVRRDDQCDGLRVVRRRGVGTVRQPVLNFETLNCMLSFPPRRNCGMPITKHFDMQILFYDVLVGGAEELLLDAFLNPNQFLMFLCI